MNLHNAAGSLEMDKSHNSEVSPARRFFPLCAPISKYLHCSRAGLRMSSTVDDCLKIFKISARGRNLKQRIWTRALAHLDASTCES